MNLTQSSAARYQRDSDVNSGPITTDFTKLTKSFGVPDDHRNTIYKMDSLKRGSVGSMVDEKRTSSIAQKNGHGRNTSASKNGSVKKRNPYSTSKESDTHLNKGIIVKDHTAKLQTLFKIAPENAVEGTTRTTGTNDTATNTNTNSSSLK